MKKELHSIKSTGFNLPKDYFDNLEDKIMDQIQLDKALNSNKNASFTVPDGYLDTLDDVILSNVSETKVISLFGKQNLLYISGIAAAVLIMFGIFWNNPTETIDTLDSELVENYIIEEGIDTYDIAALFTDEDITTINNDIFDQTFSEDSLEDYLLENVDLEDIIDQ